MSDRRLTVFVAWGVLCLTGSESMAALRVSPSAIVLSRPEGSQQLLVMEVLPEGRNRDATRAASYNVTAAGVATVDPDGLVRPVADGTAELIIRCGLEESRIPITVRGLS